MVSAHLLTKVPYTDVPSVSLLLYTSHGISTPANLMLDYVWNVMAHAQKPDFVFWWKGRVHLNRQEASVQTTTGSRGVNISGSTAGYTRFLGSVKSTGYALHSPASPSLPLLASPRAITFQLDSFLLERNCKIISQNTIARTVSQVLSAKRLAATDRPAVVSRTPSPPFRPQTSVQQQFLQKYRLSGKKLLQPAAAILIQTHIKAFSKDGQTHNCIPHNTRVLISP